jgi:hypothetical protein
MGSPTGVTVTRQWSVTETEDANEEPEAKDEPDNCLPSYLLHYITTNDQIQKEDVLQDMEEEGEGDSDNKADDVLLHGNAMVEAQDKRHTAAEDAEDIVEDNDCNSILLQKGYSPEVSIPGMPIDWVRCQEGRER